MVLMGLALACAACSQEEAPAEKVAEAAQDIVTPTPEPAATAKGKYAPQDTCGEVEGAELFRRQLATAVEAAARAATSCARGWATRRAACGQSSTR
jgi:hypothetical protein